MKMIAVKSDKIKYIVVAVLLLLMVLASLLKVLGVINISWLWITIPIWFGVALTTSVAFFLFTVFTMLYLHEVFVEKHKSGFVDGKHKEG